MRAGRGSGRKTVRGAEKKAASKAGGGQRKTAIRVKEGRLEGEGRGRSWSCWRAWPPLGGEKDGNIVHHPM
jgi:hypothetical protein